MASLDIGKPEVCKWIRENFPPTSRILDVGACDGKWKQLLDEYENMDAVEAWEPNCIAIGPMYRHVYHKDIAELEYGEYDLVIFGDVIEHLDVPAAQEVLRYAADRCRDMIVAVPYQYPQDAIYGNPWEIHKQPDLTAEIFSERYPGLEVLHDTGKNYCFYHKAQPKKPAPKKPKESKPKETAKKPRAKK